MFTFSPAGRGEEMVKAFQNAAVQTGTVLIGSNDSRNGLPGDAYPPILEALWEEARARFTIHVAFSGGFSGGARVAQDMAQNRRDAFVGVVSHGAFGCNSPLPDDAKLSFYLVAGDGDFNLAELLDAHRYLQAKGLLSFWNSFDGGHGPLPRFIRDETLAFLHFAARRQGRLPEDTKADTRFFRQAVELSDALATDGHPFKALVRLRQLAKLFPKEAEYLEARMERMARQKEAKAEEAAERRYMERSVTYSSMRGSAAWLEELQKLRKEEDDPSVHISHRAGALLHKELIVLQQIAGEAHANGNFEQALRLFEVHARLDTKDPIPSFNAACALARLGKKHEAVVQLREAVRRGFRNPHRIRMDEDLASLQGDPEFEALLKEIGS
jgi:tetratricopeptide (TPR) repeat protein